MLNKELINRIESEIKQNDIVLYMTGTPMYPQCGLSSAVVQILENLSVDFIHINTIEDPSLYDAIQEYSSWPSIPQLYIKGEFVGNGETIREMFNNGKLLELLKKVEIIKS